MNRTDRVLRLLETRRVLLPVAMAIGLVSSFLLWVTVQRDYLDYWFYPKMKGEEYFYPQLRYTLFDIVLLLWCLDGLAASGLSFWNAISSRSISGWMRRTLALYLGLLLALILGGGLMLYVR